jgi:hypothetical protein
MKANLAKELIFFFVALCIALPLGCIFLWLHTRNHGLTLLNADEQVLEFELLIIGIVLAFVGVYLARLVLWAVKTII